MRVVLLTQRYAPRFEGGTERVVRASARELAARGCEVLVLVGCDAGEEPGEATVDGLAVRFLGADPGAAGPLAERLVLARPGRVTEAVQAARDFAPDVVHVHHWATLGSDLVRRLAGALGAPVVVSLHDLFTTCPRSFRTPPAEVLPELAAGRDPRDPSPDHCPHLADAARCAPCVAPEAPGLPAAELAAGLVLRAEAFGAELEAADLLLAPSRSHADRLEAQFGRLGDRLRVLPPGLVDELPRAAAGRRVVADEPLVVLHLGHRTAVKGPVDLVLALAGAVRDTGRRARLVLAGGELDPGLDARLAGLAASAGGGLELDLRGTYTREDLPALAAGAHLAAFPSHAPESYGLVVDEALALGLPVLASEAGALGERVGEAGRVLPAGDVAAWRAALAEALDDPDRVAGWRAAVPNRMPGPGDAAGALLTLYQGLLP